MLLWNEAKCKILRLQERIHNVINMLSTLKSVGLSSTKFTAHLLTRQKLVKENLIYILYNG